MNYLDQLIYISRYYGSNPEYVIAGGGNTSLKDEELLYIKASGISLSSIDEAGFVKMSRRGLALIEAKTYPVNTHEREQAVKADLAAAVIGDQRLRPSVETSLHNLIDYRFIVHTHPTLVNGLLCSNNAEVEIENRFGKEVLYLEYTDPGYVLFKAIQKKILEYEKVYKKSPKILFLQNHGIFVAADSIEEIQNIYTYVDDLIKEGKNLSLPKMDVRTYQSKTTSVISNIFTKQGLMSKAIQSPLTDHFLANHERLDNIRIPFSPDIIVYCKSNYLFLEHGLAAAEIAERIGIFKDRHAYYPKIIIEQDGGLIAVEENEKSLETVLEVFLDFMKIAYLSEQFGGPHPMTPVQIQFIDNWEVENYRRSVAKS